MLAAFAGKVLIASVHFNPQSVEKATSVNQAAFQYSYVVHFKGGICTHGVSKQHASRGVRILETLKRRGVTSLNIFKSRRTPQMIVAAVAVYYYHYFTI